ncbi:MAG: hypothetical protein OHK0056_06830 [Bacteriovoracaceae bacterium]
MRTAQISDIVLQIPNPRAPNQRGPFPLALIQENLPLGKQSQGRDMQVSEQLKELIENYLSKYPNVSINALANKSGVGATTIRRILTTKSEPAPHTVLNIISALSNERRLSVLVTLYDGPVGQMLKSTFGPYIETMKEHKNIGDLNGELRDPIKYFIYKLSANRTGVHHSLIFKLFGKLGTEKAEELYKLGLLDLRVSGYHAREKNFSLDFKVAAGHLSELVKFYKPENVALGQNLFYTMSESVNEEGIAEIKRIQKEAIDQIFKILEDRKYHGEIPYFTLNLCDTFDYGRSCEVLQ